MARRRFQKGQLFKSGKRRKMWVGRWREDVLVKSGAIGRDPAVAGAGFRGGDSDEERGASSARSADAFCESRYGSPSCLHDLRRVRRKAMEAAGAPDVQASTQHGYKTVLRNHVLPHGRTGGSVTSSGSRFSSGSPTSSGRTCGWQTVRNCMGAALGHSRDGGRIRVSPDESSAGCEVPAAGAQRETRDHRRRQPGQAARAGRRTASDDGAVSSPRRD